MSQEAGHLSGGAAIYMRYPVRASIATAGIGIRAVTDAIGVGPVTTTAAEDVVGLGLDVATYSTTQADLSGGEGANAALGQRSYGGLDMGRMVTVSVRPDLIVRSLISGGAAENTALQLLVNTSASAGGTVITDADVSDNDMTGGIVWCIKGNNVGYARQIASDTTTTITVTVPFPRAIAVGDEFLEIPYSGFGTGAADIDGASFLQFSTLLTQADASIAAGTGAEVQVFRLDLEGASNSNVLYMFRQHQWNRHTVPS